MIETGIPKLDEYLGGGIPKGKTLLYYTQPGVEGDVFGMQTLYHNLKKGMKGIFVTSTTDPDTIRGYFKEFGWDMDEFGDGFAIIDAYSALVGLESKEKYFVEDPENLDNLDEVFKKVIDDFSGGLITCGSLSTILDIGGEDQALDYIKDWNKYLFLNDSIGVYNFTAWPYSKETLRKIKEELFNAVVEISGIAERVIFGQYYGLLKVDWNGVKEKAIMFKTLRPGGIKAFIPKILVTGPFNAGKSSFVHAISTKSVSVDRLGTTVALDHGHVDHKGFSADIFGTPGQERFDPIIKLLGGEAMGVFLIVDSTKPEDFPRAKKMLEITKGFGLPYLIVANKQDLKNALSVEDIRKRMTVPKEVPIVPAVAKDKKGVLDAFETLIDKITEVS